MIYFYGSHLLSVLGHGNSAEIPAKRFQHAPNQPPGLTLPSILHPDTSGMAHKSKSDCDLIACPQVKIQLRIKVS